MKRQLLLAAVPLALLVAACSTSPSATSAPATPAPATSAPAESTAPAGDIVATAKAAGSFGTLLKAAVGCRPGGDPPGRRPVHGLRSD